MNYLSAEELSKAYDERQLFSGITLGLEQGKKAAIVGLNGSGKSTLLKILAGIETPDTGVVSIRKGLKRVYLSQVPEYNPLSTVGDILFDESSPQLQAIKAYELCTHLTPNDTDKLSKCIDEIDRLNAWSYEQEVHSILSRLDIFDLQKKIGEMSGGQKKRLALAQALVKQPDLLILDEPTNHLDLEAIEWLEEYLSTTNLTLLLVTHDRYFLDRITQEIFELDQGKIFKYKGNYSRFLEQKEERMLQESASVDKARNLMRKELDWMRRQPKARGTKAKYRVDAFYDLKEKASGSQANATLEINLGTKRQGRKIIEIEKLRVEIGGKCLIEDFEHIFQRGERVGIVGPNGVGKSTFLNTLTGKIKPVFGKIDKGQNTEIGFFTQEEALFDPSKRVIDTVTEVAEVIPLENGSQVTASQLLNQFLFAPSRQYTQVGKLSGGERKRLQLLRVLMANPNFLILDEPTNDLDLVTLNILEEYLENFTGCLLLVSHDRYFMDRLVDHLFVFEGNGKIKDFPGNYTDFREQNIKETSNVNKTSESATETTLEIRSTKKLSYKESQELEGLEGELKHIAAQINTLEKEIGEQSDYQKISSLSENLRLAKENLEQKEWRWLELIEKK